MQLEFISCLQHCDLGLYLPDGEDRHTPHVVARFWEDSVDEEVPLGAELAVDGDGDGQLGIVCTVV